MPSYEEERQESAFANRSGDGSDDETSTSSSSEGDNVVEEDSVSKVQSSIGNTKSTNNLEETDGKFERDVSPPDGTTEGSSTTKTFEKEKTAPSRKSKKRSRKDMNGTISERQLALKVDRYNKLLHQAKKQLMKQAKKVRAFMVQRNIRKLKNQNKDQKEDNDDVEQRLLRPLKELSLELVVEQAIRQLGLLHANPSPDATFGHPSAPSSNEQSKLVSSVLDHKRFQASLEEWNEKVADFRRFCLQLDDRNSKFPSQDTLVSKKRSKKGKGAKTTTSLRAQSQEQEQSTSRFCDSLNGGRTGNNDDGNNDMMAYGPAAGMDDDNMMFQAMPKNRRGQRARKAKAMALQAKKEGRQYQSLNWREEKKATKDDKKEKAKDDRENFSRKRNIDQKQDVIDVDQGNHVSASSQENAVATHPSWAAKQQQKSGIVAFQGKKITFD